MAGNKGRNQPVPQKDQLLPESLIKDFFDVQKEEINIRKEELKFQIQRDQNQKSYAEQALKAQLQDRNHDRTHIEQKTKIYFIGGYGFKTARSFQQEQSISEE